ncbi:hypothetical protein P4S63_19420 [Pseudoalteromonas sp. B193]
MDQMVILNVLLNEQKLRLAAEQLLKDKSSVLVAINNELQKK